MLEGSGIMELRRILKAKGSGRKHHPIRTATVPLSGAAEQLLTGLLHISALLASGAVRDECLLVISQNVAAFNGFPVEPTVQMSWLGFGTPSVPPFVPPFVPPLFGRRFCTLVS